MATQFSGFPQFLFVRNLITSEVLSQLIHNAKQYNITFVKSIIDYKYLREEQIAKLIAEYFHYDYLDFDTVCIDKINIKLLSNDLILKHNILPLDESNNQLRLAIYDPTNFSSLNTIKFHAAKEVKFVIVEYSKLINCLQKLFSGYSEGVNTEDKSIVNLVDKILSTAIRENASDIHFEPFENECRIRFRIDGLLCKKMVFASAIANQITSRFKVMSRLDISEKRLPQDGRFSFNFENAYIRDCRISTIPVTYGEKIVIRLLNPKQDMLRLDSLGLEFSQKKIFEKYIALPQGMIIVTGPTGSGKTLTLLSAINILNTEHRNISTAEDPIEIVLPGINQVEVNQKIGLNFSTALRAFLRQDPDVIMIGEIRDLETAEIATKASGTGHLVFSSLHTNTAAEAVIRLRSIGVNVVDLSNSISLIIAQRLVRKLCSFCKKTVTIDDPIKFVFNEITDFNDNSIIYKASGCEKCESGYKGRVGVFEFLPISENISHMILQNEGATEIFAKASSEGMLSLRKAALLKVLQGVTSLEEISRVIVL